MNFCVWYESLKVLAVKSATSGEICW